MSKARNLLNYINEELDIDVEKAEKRRYKSKESAQAALDKLGGGGKLKQK